MNIDDAMIPDEIVMQAVDAYERGGTCGPTRKCGSACTSDEEHRMRIVLATVRGALWLSPEVERLREALRQIADGQHGFRRPAGAIASAALAGKPLPGWDR